MLASIVSSGLSGVEGCSIGVEVDTVPGLPTFDIIGLPDASVREAKDRVRSALRNSGFEFPMRRITVNLSPADMRKVGTGLDLPIALGILASIGLIPDARRAQYSAIGELSLDGQVRRITGAVPMTAHLVGRGSPVVVPLGNMRELSLMSSPYIHPVSSLREAVELIQSGFRRHVARGPQTEDGPQAASGVLREVNLRDVVGLLSAKRALEVAASGGHHVLMVGPPGVGKSLLARALHGLLPDLNPSEAVEVLGIYSAIGMPCDSPLRRPLRLPHQSISARALVGGGAYARPGEVSLAHKGVLVLDELPEFRRDCIESLRQPLEVGDFSISRARWTYRFPCDFQMVGTSNLCPCGNRGKLTKECKCSEKARASYLGKLSGPLLDRIDIYIQMGPYCDEAPSTAYEDSAVVAARVAGIRRLQTESRGCLSVRAEHRDLIVGHMSPEALSVLDRATQQTGMSMRSQAKALRVARTIADMAGADVVRIEHIQEALQYRTPLSQLVM